MRNPDETEIKNNEWIEHAAEIRKFNDKIKIILITAFFFEDLMISETYKITKINEIVQKQSKLHL
jgi:hypothetical protein